MTDTARAPGAQGPEDADTDLTSIVRDVRAGGSDRVLLVDFDHTLFGSNSTEAFLAQARPGFVASILLLVIRGLVPWKRFAGPHWYRTRDYAAAMAVGVLMPWNLARWRRSAAAVFSQHSHHWVAEALLEAPPERTILVSFGLQAVIAPMLKGSHWETCRLICMPFGGKLDRLRHGKLAMAESALSRQTIADAAFVTDSELDRDLLDRVRAPLLIEPIGEVFAAEERLYLPMRYTVLAKYNRDYARDQFIFVDFAIAVLATFPSPFAVVQWIAAVALLLLSLMAVYEIGYFENDKVAARDEAKPTLSKISKRFDSFPLERYAWQWALVLGALGCALLSTGQDGSKPVAVSFGSKFAVWCVTLLLVRALYYIYNRIRPNTRILMYPVLQAAKYLGVFMVVTPHLLGVLLASAQIITMCAVYAVYRSGGDKTVVSRERLRPVLFAIFVAAVALAGVAHFSAGGWIPLILMALWCLWRMTRRTVDRVTRAAARAGKRLILARA